MNNTAKRVKNGVRLEFAGGTIVTLTCEDAIKLAEALAWEASQGEPVSSACKGLTEVFTLREGEFQLMLDGVLLPHTWNSKGAAEAAIPVERERAARKLARQAVQS